MTIEVWLKIPWSMHSHFNGLSARARGFSLCSLNKHTISTKNIPMVFQKIIIHKPSAGFPPSLRLKEHQTKHTSLIPTERLQEISWQDFWRSHAPRGASSCSGKMARWILPHEQPCYKLFYLTRQQLTLLRSLLFSYR